MTRMISDGTPGEVWVNDTPRVLYQFHAALHNTCGICLQYHNKIGSWWPIPIHFGCRCLQTPIAPGAQAPHPFVDFRQLLADMPHAQQVAAIGASAYKLLDAGIVPWDEIVTPGRIRTLREIVSRRKLSVEQLVDAGIRPSIAEAAHAAVHTPEHEIAEAQRREAIARLVSAGVPQQALVDALAKGLAGRASVGVIGEDFGATGTPAGFAPLPGTGGGSASAAIAAQLAAHLAAWTPPRPAPKAPPPEPAYRVPRSREERLKLSADWRAGLEPEERDGLSAYVGHGYQVMNDYLRTGEVPHELAALPPEKARAYLDRNVAGLDTALAKARLDRPLEVWRGVRSLKAIGLDPDNLIGATVTDPAYLSTSLARARAQTFVRGDKGGAIFRIRAPAGSRGGYVGDLAMLESEQEVLFARGSTLRIAGARRGKDGILVIDAELAHGR